MPGGFSAPGRGTPPAASGLSDATNDQRRPFMADYRDPNFVYRSPGDDPLTRDAKLDPAGRAGKVAWGWTAAAIFLVVVFAVAFGASYWPRQGGTHTAANDVTPPAAIHIAPPAPVPAPTFAPTPPPPAAPPITPQPNPSAHPGNTQ
jgi:hypothetical protein